MAGKIFFLSSFLSSMHQSNIKLSSRHPPHQTHRNYVHEAFVKLAHTHLKPFEDVYRDKSILPIRGDDSIFISLASFRDYLLVDTLLGAFNQASIPTNYSSARSSKIRVASAMSWARIKTAMIQPRSAMPLWVVMESNNSTIIPSIENIATMRSNPRTVRS